MALHGTGNFSGHAGGHGAAQKSIRLETYIYSDGKLGRQFLETLLAAAQRGVRVHVLVDAAWFMVVAG